MDDRFDGGRDLGVPLAHRGRRRRAVRRSSRGRISRTGPVRIGNGGAPGEQLKEDHAEGIKVAPGIWEASPVLEGLEVLGGHVRQRAADQGGRGVRSQLGVGGQVEVEQERLAVVAQQDVGRLEVAMEDAALVGVGQAVGQACDKPEDRLDVAELADALELGVARISGGPASGGGPLVARVSALAAAASGRDSLADDLRRWLLSRPAPESGRVWLCFSSRRTSAKVPEPR